MNLLPKTWAIIPFTFFQMIALSTNFYIVPQLILTKVCQRTFNNTVCGDLGHNRYKAQENYVFSKAAAWNALINFAGFFPATIITLPFGAMTDLVSKRKMLLIPAVATLVSGLLQLLSAILIRLPVGYLAFATFAISIYGEIPGCITLCCVYTASASNGNKTIAVSMVIATVEIALGIGGLTANYLKRYYGFSSVFMFATIVLFVNLLYTIILIPPTDEANEKSPQKEQYHFWNDFKEHTRDTWLHLLSFIKKHILDSKEKTILLLLIAAFLNLASYGGERALITLFLKHSPLNLTADNIGIYFVLFQSVRGFGLVLLVLVGKRYCHPSDYTLMFIGTFSMIMNYTVTSVSTTMLMVYLSTILALPTSFAASALRSKLIKLVAPEEYGISLSLVTLMDVFSNLIMGAVANGFFIATVKIYSGFSILLMSSANFVALTILCYAFCTSEKEETANNDYHGVPSEDDSE